MAPAWAELAGSTFDRMATLVSTIVPFIVGVMSTIAGVIVKDRLDRRAEAERYIRDQAAKEWERKLGLVSGMIAAASQIEPQLRDGYLYERMMLASANGEGAAYKDRAEANWREFHRLAWEVASNAESYGFLVMESGELIDLGTVIREWRERIRVCTNSQQQQQLAIQLVQDLIADLSDLKRIGLELKSTGKRSDVVPNSFQLRILQPV